jgi:hypothetical protein
MKKYSRSEFEQPSLLELTNFLKRDQLDSEIWKSMSYASRATFLRSLWKLAIAYNKQETENAESDYLH